jgi:hypothetical protein
MPYIKRVVKAGRVLEITKYYSGRYGHHERNAPPVAKTPDKTERSNRKRQERELAWLLDTNFEDKRDALVTLSWREDQIPPDSSERMKKDSSNFFRRMRKSYQQKGKDLRYVYTMEIGPKGSRHIHAVISEADLSEIQSCWDGVVNVVPLFSDGNYDKIAQYFVKYSVKTEETEGIKVGRRYSSSRNLKKPKVIKTVVNAATFKETPGQRKGYKLDESRTETGISEETGLRYARFVYISTAPARQETKNRGGQNNGRARGAGRDPDRDA